MNDQPPEAAKVAPSTARNRDPILAVLKSRLPPTGFILEVAAGAGEHTVYNAKAFPDLRWQPTDPDPEAIMSIAAWREQADLHNILKPVSLDASCPERWPVDYADAIININMIHVAPWAATQGLMTGASRILPTGGILFLYGPSSRPASKQRKAISRSTSP